MEIIRVAWGDTTPRKINWCGEPTDTFAPEHSLPIYYSGNFYLLEIQTWYNMDWSAKEKAVFMLLKEEAKKKKVDCPYTFNRYAFRDGWSKKNKLKRFRFANMFPYVQEAHVIYNTPRGEYAIQSPVPFVESVHDNEGYKLLMKLNDVKKKLKEINQEYLYSHFERLYHANRIDTKEGQSQMLLEDAIKYINKQSNK